MTDRGYLPDARQSGMSERRFAYAFFGAKYHGAMREEHVNGTVYVTRSCRTTV